MDLIRNPIPAFIGRDNVEKLDIKKNGERVTAFAVTRIVFRFGNYCLDTDLHPDLFYFLDSNRIIAIKLGLVPNLITGTHRGQFTVFDAEHPNGCAWKRASVRAYTWEKCPT